MHLSILITKVLLLLMLLLVVDSQRVKNIAVSSETTTLELTSEESSSSILTQTLNDLSSLVRSILAYFSSSPIRDDTLRLLHKTINKLTNTLEVFGAKMLDATEIVAKEIFISLKQKLYNIEVEFQDLSRLTDEKFERVINYVNNTMIEQSLNMEEWANQLKHQLRSMNDSTIYRKLCPAIDALIKQTTDELYGCCNIVIKPVRSICRNVRTILRETFQVVAGVVDTVDNCIFSDKKIDSMVISCIEDIYDRVSDLTARATELRHELVTKLPTKIMSNFCISMVSVSMTTRKSNVEEQIESFNMN